MEALPNLSNLTLDEKPTNPGDLRPKDLVKPDHANYKILVNDRITIDIVKGSICGQTTDAITNAANS